MRVVVVVVVDRVGVEGGLVIVVLSVSAARGGPVAGVAFCVNVGSKGGGSGAGRTWLISGQFAGHHLTRESGQEVFSISRVGSGRIGSGGL